MKFDFKVELKAELSAKVEVEIAAAVKAAVKLEGIVAVEAKLEAKGSGKADAKLQFFVKAGATVAPAELELQVNAAVKADKKLEELKVVKDQKVLITGMH